MKAWQLGRLGEKLSLRDVPMPEPRPGSVLVLLGQSMHPADAYRWLLDLVRSGLLDIGPIRPRLSPLAALPDAMEAAAQAGNFETIAVEP